MTFDSKNSRPLQMALSLLLAASSLAPMVQAAESGKGKTNMSKEAATCPYMPPARDASLKPTVQGAFNNGDWWPNQLNLQILEQNSTLSNPMDSDFKYADEFKKLDLNALKKDIDKLMVTSQDWWPSDFGNYGPFFIRMAWHSAGTYRVEDGRGGASYGTQRFAPLNSWPDNANLDKARRLLWPIKQKYGKQISWADLMVFTGNCAYEMAGLKTFGYAGGREDVWEPQNDIYWGPETKWLGDKRYTGDRQLQKPLAAVQMGLIYVNPEGPDGNPDPLKAAKDIRETFGRMAMNDKETVALIAGGHTLGKTHGAAPPAKYVGREPEGAAVEEQGLGWKNSFGTGSGDSAITSGLEGSWTATPTKWSNIYFDNLFGHEWKVIKGPGGGNQWTPVDAAEKDAVPDAQDSSKKHPPMMFTTDLALKLDPIYGPISKHYHEHPDEFQADFAKAWYKLIHRDLGPISRCLGPRVAPPQLWQDPIPAIDYKLVDDSDVADLKAKALASGLTVPELVSTAWKSATTFRGSDKRGGANGARICLAPQKDWEINNPAELSKALSALEKIKDDFNAAQTGGKKISMADMIVLGGCAGVEAAAKNAGHSVTVPFTPGRGDATQEQTDVESVNYLDPHSDGFRNFRGKNPDRSLDQLLIDRAQKLTLTAPEMTVLLGGMRVLNTNADHSKNGVFTKQPEKLTNDFFVNLLDMSTKWEKSSSDSNLFIGKDRKTGSQKWTGSLVDLTFGSNSQLRAISEVYASDDGNDKFVKDFVSAWNKVMNLDRFDIDPSKRYGGKAVPLGQS